MRRSGLGRIAVRRKLLALGGVAALLGAARAAGQAAAGHTGDTDNVFHLEVVNNQGGMGETSSNLSQTVLVANTGAGFDALRALNLGAGGIGLTGVAGESATGTGGIGVRGRGGDITATGTGGIGVEGTGGGAPSGTGGVGVRAVGGFGANGAGLVAIGGGTHGANPGLGVFGTGGTASAPGAVGAVGVFGVGGTGPGGQGFGVSGFTTSAATAGVIGANGGAGVGVEGRSGNIGQGAGTGVQGKSGSGRGVLGQSTSGAGVEGNSGSNFGIVGTSTSAAGLSGLSVNGEGILALTQASNKFGLVVLTPQNTTPGAFIKGTIVSTGTAISALQTSRGLTSLYGVQAAEALLEDVGRARLVNGRAQVALDPVFAQTIETDEYEVFPVPRGECRGLFIASTDARGFEVRELGGGTSEVEFGYRVVGKRKDMQNRHRLATVEVPDASKLKLPVPAVPERSGPELAPGVDPSPPTPRRTPGR